MLQAIRQPPVEERDYSAHVLLEWFVDEQVEEEKSLTDIIDHLDMTGNDGTGLLLLDSRLGARTGAE